MQVILVEIDVHIFFLINPPPRKNYYGIFALQKDGISVKNAA